MDENLKNLNKLVGNYEQVSKIQLYPTEFEKTPKKHQTILIQQHCRRIKYVLKHATNQQN